MPQFQCNKCGEIVGERPTHGQHRPDSGTCGGLLKPLKLNPATVADKAGQHPFGGSAAVAAKPSVTAGNGPKPSVEAGSGAKAPQQATAQKPTQTPSSDAQPTQPPKKQETHETETLEALNSRVGKLASEAELDSCFASIANYEIRLKAVNSAATEQQQFQILRSFEQQLLNAKPYAARYCKAMAEAQDINKQIPVPDYLSKNVRDVAFRAAQEYSLDEPAKIAEAMETFRDRIAAVKAHAERFAAAEAEVEKLKEHFNETTLKAAIKSVQTTAVTIDKPAGKADRMEELLRELKDTLAQATTSTASQPESKPQPEPQQPAKPQPHSQPQAQQPAKPMAQPKPSDTPSQPKAPTAAQASSGDGGAQALEQQLEGVKQKIEALRPRAKEAGSSNWALIDKLRVAGEEPDKAKALEILQSYLAKLESGLKGKPGAAEVKPAQPTTSAQGSAATAQQPKPTAQAQPTSSAQSAAQPQTATPQQAVPHSSAQPQQTQQQAAQPEAGTPEAKRKAKNEAAKTAVEAAQKEIDLADTPEKKQVIVDKSVQRVEKLKPEEIGALPVSEQISLLRQIQVPLTANGKPTAEQKKALAAMFRSIKLDKDFAEDDKVRRQAVLEQLVAEPTLVQGQADWGKSKALTPEKKKVLEKAQELQCKTLGFQANPIKYEALKDGEAGVCSGKTVKISTVGDAIADFNEVIDTVIHETTHAYQHHLVELLDAGKLGVDDPRYAQAWLFKLNKGNAYLDPPDKLTDEEKKDEAKAREYADGYAAYKDQPLELHAWKAGNEAGRAFDIKALKLQMAALVDDITALTPDANSKATALQKRLNSEGAVMKATEIIAEIDELATAAYDAAKERAAAIYPGASSFESGGYAKYLAEWKAVDDSKSNVRAKVRPMKQLAEKLEELKRKGDEVEARFEEVNKKAMEFVSSIGNYVENGFEIYKKERMGIAELKEPFSARLPKMEAFLKRIEAVTAEGILQKEKAAAALKELEEKFDAALEVVDALGPFIGSYVVNGYETEYAKKRKAIVDDEKLTKAEQLEKMTALKNRLTQLTEQGKRDKAAWDAAWSSMSSKYNTQAEVDEANRISNLKLSPGGKLKELKASPILAGARKRAGVI